MAITGVSSISGQQIIAAGALSAASAGTALFDENGNAITGYLTAVPEGYATTADLTGKQDTLTFGYNESNAISSINESAIAGGSAPAYGYTDNGLISAIDTSGLYASSGSANHLRYGGTMGRDITQSDGANNFLYMPTKSPWTTATVATGIFSPLQYATGACLAMNAGNFKAYFKGNEWFVGNTAIGQMLRGETHQSRGVHISGATNAGYGFNLGILSVSGVNSTGSWKYGYQEDAALRAVSSCDMHESAFSYDASDNITAYNGSAFKAGDEFPQSATEAIEAVTANSGAWGGSALPISAGPGIKFEMADGTLVASNDETVLYSYTGTTKVSTGVLSEPATNFDLLRVTFREIYGSSNLICGNLVGWIDMSMIDSNSKSGCSVYSFQDGNTTGNVGLRYGTFELTAPNAFSSMQGYRQLNSTAAPGSVSNLWPVKVVGINRIAGGN